MVDIAYWNKFYNTGVAPKDHSSFAESVIRKISRDGVLLEMGCGNGRDAFYFDREGIDVWALDISSQISSLVAESGKRPKFICADFTKLETPYHDIEFATVYSRFTLHSIKVGDATRALKWAFDNLRPGGLFLIEVRSILDPMCGTGTPVEGERDAWINTHYRRFLRKNELVAELEGLHFDLEHVEEANNLAVYGDDNPVVIRIHARKPNSPKPIPL